MSRKGPPQTTVKQDTQNVAGYDRCWTPWHGAAILFPYLRPRSIIWEPFAGDGWLARWLREAGHTVICSDLSMGAAYNFLTYEPKIPYRYIISNPPYSVKVDMVERVYQLQAKRPWIAWSFLMPDATGALDGMATLAEQYHDWEELIPRQRINFCMPDTGFVNNGAQFTTTWFCSGLLPRPRIHVKLPAPRPEHRLIRPKKPTKAELAAQAVANATRKRMRVMARPSSQRAKGIDRFVQ